MASRLSWRGACSLALQTLSRDRLEIVARSAVADVELIADNREPHRVRAEKELPVFDGVKTVKTDVAGNVRGTPAVPACPVAGFWLCVAHLACCGTYPGGSAAPSPKKNSSICLATSSCASFCHGMRRYSLRIIFMRSSQSFQASAEMLS